MQNYFLELAVEKARGEGDGRLGVSLTLSQQSVMPEQLPVNMPRWKSCEEETEKGQFNFLPTGP